MWKQNSYAPISRPDREMVSKYEEDTEPLGPISGYDIFRNRLDIGLLSNRKEKGYSLRRYSAIINEDDLQGLSDGVKEFLQVNSYGIERPQIQLSVQHDGGKESWLSIKNRGRKVRFIFDRDGKAIYSQMLVKKGGEEWRVESETRDNTLCDTDETLKIFESLVNRTSPA